MTSTSWDLNSHLVASIYKKGKQFAKKIRLLHFSETSRIQKRLIDFLSLNVPTTFYIELL